MSQPSTVGAILPVVAKFLGVSPTLKRGECLAAINACRNGWWKIEAMRQTIFKWVDCVCIQSFVDECNGSCVGRSYLGVTLPVNAVGVEHIEWNGTHIPVTVVESHNPRSIYGGVAWPGVFGSPMYRAPIKECAELLTYQPCLQNEIPHRYQGKLMVRCADEKDSGKRCGVRYVTHRNEIMREDIALSTSGTLSTWSPIKVLEITFPFDRCSWVTVSTEDGYVLGAYHPSTIAPKHNRIRLMGLQGCGCGGMLQVEGVMEPLNVMFDTDRVEVASEVDWRNGLMALDLHFKTGKSQSEMVTLQQATQFASASADSELKAQETIPVASLKPRGVKNSLRKISFLERRRGWLWR